MVVSPSGVLPTMTLISPMALVLPNLACFIVSADNCLAKCLALGASPRKIRKLSLKKF